MPGPVFSRVLLSRRQHAAERKKLQEIELQRVSDLSFVKCIKEITQNLSIEEIQNSPITLDLDSYVIDLGKLGKFQYDTKAEIKIEEKEDPYYLLHCTLTAEPENKKAFDPFKADYLLLINTK